MEPSPVDFIQPLAEIAIVIMRILKLVSVIIVGPFVQRAINLTMLKVNGPREAENMDSLAEMSLIKAHREELLQWHASLPTHLQFSYEVQGLDSTTIQAPYSWRARQLSSLRIRECNHPLDLSLVYPFILPILTKSRTRRL